MTIARFTKENKAALLAKQKQSEEEAKSSLPASQRVTKIDINPNREMIDIDSPAVKKFVESAPDGMLTKQARIKEEKTGVKEKKRDANGRILRGRRVVITLALKPNVLDQVDARAKAQGLNRSEFFDWLIKKELIMPQAPFSMH